MEMSTLDRQATTSSESEPEVGFQNDVADVAADVVRLPPLLQGVVDKIGKIDESRIVASPEYINGEVPTLFR